MYFHMLKTYVVHTPSRFQVRPRQIVLQTTQFQILTQVPSQEIKISDNPTNLLDPGEYHKLVITITSHKLYSCSDQMLEPIYYLLAMF